MGFLPLTNFPICLAVKLSIGKTPEKSDRFAQRSLVKNDYWKQFGDPEVWTVSMKGEMFVDWKIKLVSAICFPVFWFVVSANQAASPPPLGKPTGKKLQETQKAFAELGACYWAETDARTKQQRHVFSMPMRTTDADLKKLPVVSFHFTLDLRTPTLRMPA